MPRSSNPATPELAIEPTAELEAAFRTHGRWLLDFLRKRFGYEAAEDLAQEAYVRIARTRPGLRSPKAVLAITALNAARDQARRRAVRPRLTSVEQALEQASCLPDQAEALMLKEVVLCLPHNLRAVFLLSRFAGLTYEEIAQQRGVSVKTVEGHMTKALAICAARLRD
jgi:RNA polymerase sigma-70 factor (ECF subfamily)